MKKGRKPGKSKRVFVLVTNDKYEHPISQPMTLEQMALYISKPVKYVLYAVTPSAAIKRKKYKKPYKSWAIVAFEEDDDE